MADSKLNVMPVGIGFLYWADTVVIDNPSYPRAETEEQWRNWADQVSQSDSTVPDHRNFDDWRSWAQQWFGYT